MKDKDIDPKEGPLHNAAQKEWLLADREWRFERSGLAGLMESMRDVESSADIAFLKSRLDRVHDAASKLLEASDKLYEVEYEE